MAQIRRKVCDLRAEAKPPQACGVLQQPAGLYPVEDLIRGEPAEVPDSRDRPRAAGQSCREGGKGID